MTGESAAPAEMRLNEKALAAAVSVGSNMAGEHLVRQIVTEYLTVARSAAPAGIPGVEEMLRRIVAEARSEPEPEAIDFAVENIKALFAQKAVKPPTREDDAASSEIAVQSQLAAEAALAEVNLRQSERIRQLEAALAAEREANEALAVGFGDLMNAACHFKSTLSEIDRECLQHAVDRSYDLLKAHVERTDAAAAIRAEGE